MSKEKSGDSNEKISANDPDYVNPFTGERPNRKSPSPDIDHLTVKDMKSGEQSKWSISEIITKLS